MYEKILVTSTGEYLDEIIEHTLDLIHGRPMEVLGLYVVETSVPFLTPSKIKEMMAMELKEKGKEVLKRMEDGFQEQFKDINFKPIISEGDPAHEIVKIAEKENVDVIVLGTGKSSIDKHLLGSVSEKVVHSATSSILLVRSKHRPLEDIE